MRAMRGVKSKLRPAAALRPARWTEKLFVVLLLTALIACADACSGDRGSSQVTARGHGPGGGHDRGSIGSGPPPVEAVQARSGALPLTEEVSGVVRAVNQVAIRPEIEAPIVAVLVRSGETVERGQVLIRLEDDALRERLRQAQADVRLAEATAEQSKARVAELAAQVKRTRALAKEDLVPAVDLETQEAQLDGARAQARQSEARVEQARATLDERKNALSKTVVRAPVAGRVGRRDAELGMLATPSTTLFRLGDFDELIVEVPLTESMLAHVREGMPVRIGAASLDRPIDGSLSRISPFLEQGSFSTTGEIDVSNAGDRLRPGMFVTVDVLYGQSEHATLVPATALWEDPRTGVEGVFVVRGMDDVAAPAATLSEHPYPVEFREVEVLAEGQGTLGIRGAEDGDWVVTVGQHLLSERQESSARVRPARWDRILAPQALQREDLLHGFLEKQQRLARTFGADIPELGAEMPVEIGEELGSALVAPRDPSGSAGPSESADGAGAAPGEGGAPPGSAAPTARGER